MCFVSFKTVSQVFVQKFFSVVIRQWPTSLIVFVYLKFLKFQIGSPDRLLTTICDIVYLLE